MLKYLIPFVLLVGCGGPQTPTEVKADDMLNEFTKDCKSIHGARCESPMVVATLVESKEEQTCWAEDGSALKHLVLHRDSVVQNDRATVYQVMFECNLNLGALESNLSKFDEFALALGLTR